MAGFNLATNLLESRLGHGGRAGELLLMFPEPVLDYHTVKGFPSSVDAKSLVEKGQLPQLFFQTNQASSRPERPINISEPSKSVTRPNQRTVQISDSSKSVTRPNQ